MTPARWREVTRVYAAVAARDPAARAEALATACGTDEELRRDVEALLAEDGSIVIDRPAFAVTGVLPSEMPVHIGSQIGVYRVDALLGVGGMGEVYRARDTKLNRDVAIKLLPAALASDPERLARFKREARVFASLNHPNIATIHGFEDANGMPALVMELVDGETLADRIAHAPVPVADALTIARQMADALEAAHEQGIIHRDLKPANVKVRPDGTVKVLDFGLAKAMEPAGVPGATASMSPTITTPAMTAAGIILGTAAYMSPEQAKGKPADKRSDIWAFGCVLYEMLTGTRAFEGEDVSDTLAAVLRGQPDWTALPANIPEAVRLMLSRCLEKDRSKRVSDIGTARFLITEPAVTALGNHAIEASPAPPAHARQRVVLMAASAAVGALIATGVWAFRSVPVSPPTVARFTFRLPDKQHFTNPGRHMVALSPDGTHMAYVANQRLYLKALWELDATAVVTGDVGGITTPVFSPDGQWVAFWASPGTVNKISIAGGAAVRLCEASNPFGMSWSGDTLLIGEGTKGILRVPDKGGTPEVVIHVKDDEIAHGPQLLPDGRTVLFTVATGTTADRWDRSHIVVQAIGSTDRKTIVSGGADARYIATGHIIYALKGVLFAERFDLRRLETHGGPVPVVEGVQRANVLQTGAAHFAVSDTGSLVYVSGLVGGPQGGAEVALLDHTGTVERLKLPPQNYQAPRFSPNGQQLAIGIDDGRDANIWVYDLKGNSLIRQLTFGGKNRFPSWTRDGVRIAFQSDRDGDQSIFWQRADGNGTAERLTKADRGEAHIPDAWSPDGNVLLFSARTALGPFSLRTFTVHDKKVAPLAEVQSTSELQAGFSRDGRWVTYALANSTDELGSIYVRPFPPTDVLFRLESGVSPFWAPDGKSLYFVSRPGADTFSIVNIRTEPSFTFSEAGSVPRPTIAGGGANVPRPYDIAPDGQHIVTLVPAATDGMVSSDPPIQFVLNWTEELKQRVPTR